MLFATIVIVVGVILWRIRTIRKNSQLRKSFSGPRGYPLIGNVTEIAFAPRNRRMEITRNYFKIYGPIYRLYIELLDVNVIHSASADFIQSILSSNSIIRKGYFYEFLKPWLSTGLLTSDAEKWRGRRKMLTPAFHFSILNIISDVVRRSSEILVEKLELEVNSEGFDVTPYLSRCTLDVVCEAAMNVRIDSQRGLSKEYLQSVLKITEQIADRINNPLLHADFIHRFTKNYKNQQENLNVLRRTCLNIIHQRVLERQTQKQEPIDSDTSNEKKKAFLDLLLDISDQMAGSLSIDDILEEVSTFMFEGHDTTASSLAWTVFLIGHYPEVQRNIFDELDEIFGSSTRLPEQNDLAKMKYLECVFKEALRLYPPVPLISRTLTEDTKIGDHVIPAGVDVALHIHQLHRSPEHFKNPNNFDPSHFFPEEVRDRHSFAYIPFSAGPRNCVGQKFATIEEKIILSQIFRNFEVESLQKVEENNGVPDLVLRPEFGVQIKIKKRNFST